VTKEPGIRNKINTIVLKRAKVVSTIVNKKYVLNVSVGPLEEKLIQPFYYGIASSVCI
jgi:hypothetical protein